MSAGGHDAGQFAQPGERIGYVFQYLRRHNKVKPAAGERQAPEITAHQRRAAAEAPGDHDAPGVVQHTVADVYAKPAGMRASLQHIAEQDPSAAPYVAHAARRWVYV